MFHNWLKKNQRKLIRFGIVGFSGTVLNFTIYFISVEIMNFYINLGAVLAFAVAVTSNYIFNHIWTFEQEKVNNYLYVEKYIYYIICNLGGLFINLIALNTIVLFLGIDYHIIGQLVGIISGTLINFILAKEFVFIKK